MLGWDGVARRDSVSVTLAVVNDIAIPAAPAGFQNVVFSMSMFLNGAAAVTLGDTTTARLWEGIFANNGGVFYRDDRGLFRTGSGLALILTGLTGAPPQVRFNASFEVRPLEL